MIRHSATALNRSVPGGGFCPSACVTSSDGQPLAMLQSGTPPMTLEQIVDKVVEVPQVQEVIRHVPRVEVQEHVREVTRIEIQTVDKEVEVLPRSTAKGSTTEYNPRP